MEERSVGRSKFQYSCGPAWSATPWIEFTRAAISCRSRPAACGRLNFIPIILDQPVIEKTITLLGLQVQATPRE